MKSVSIKFPDKMVDFIEEISVDDMLDFKRAAFLLYAYIDAGKLSHGRAAELLGVDKFDLIDFYGGHGLEYVNYPSDKYAEAEDKLIEHFDRSAVDYD